MDYREKLVHLDVQNLGNARILGLVCVVPLIRNSAISSIRGVGIPVFPCATFPGDYLMMKCFSREDTVHPSSSEAARPRGRKAEATS